jgi:PAS domain S-box-containing protein
MPFSLPNSLRFAITNIPLRWVLVLPFVVQTVGAVALVGYLSYRSGQQATENLAYQLLGQTSERVRDRLDSYLQLSQQIVAANHLAVEQKTLNLSDREQLQQRLWQQMMLNPSISSSIFWSEEGFSLGYARIISVEEHKYLQQITDQNFPKGTLLLQDINPSNGRQIYRVDSQGKPEKLVYQFQDDFRFIPWYLEAISVGKRSWTSVFVGRLIPTLHIMAVAPVYDATGNFLGLFSSNYWLSEISSFLNRLRFSATGQVFIVERSGDLVATSVLLEASGMKQVNGKPTRLSALNSQDKRTREVAQKLIYRFTSFRSFQHTQQLSLIVSGQRQFVQVMPYQENAGLDWLVVTIIPESDFMAEIKANKQRTIVVCLLTLMGTSLLSILTARLITQPILKLNAASVALAEGRWQETLSEELPITELKSLTHCFNRTAAQLQQSFDRIKIALAESKEKFTIIFRSSPDPIAIVTYEEGARFLEVNERMSEFYGYSREELLGSTATELGLWVNWQELQEFKQLLASGGVYNFEMTTRTKSGATRVILVSGERCYLEGQEATIVVIKDISDRQQAEALLREKEHFLSTIYHGVGNPIFVVDVVGADFRFAGLNSAHERLTGLCSSQLKGKTPEETLPPTVAAHVRQHYQDCVDAGGTITYEEKLYLKDQDTWWITSLTPLKDEDGRIYRIVGSSINITAQKHAQQILELQAIIISNIAEGLCLIRESDSVIVYTNPKFQQIFGYEAEELIGQPAWMINYEDQHSKTTAAYEALTAHVKQHREIIYEVQNIKKDGTLFWCQATTSVFEHPEYGTVFVSVQQDITEKKQTQEKITASLKEKEVLLQEIHHRVKNNLGIVSSLLQMQCRRTTDQEATTILRDSQNRISSIALVHEKLYRSEDLANIDFAQYIPDLTTHLFESYNVNSSDIQLNIAVDDVSLDIETAIPCGLIINELISNALKYAFPHEFVGEINIKLCSHNNNFLSLIVRDNGVGFPEEFDAKKAKTLGMTLVQGLVKQLKGSVEINSEMGTEFKIYFPKSKV